jgi:hypothetical protein
MAFDHSVGFGENKEWWSSAAMMGIGEEVIIGCPLTGVTYAEDFSGLIYAFVYFDFD